MAKQRLNVNVSMEDFIYRRGREIAKLTHGGNLSALITEMIRNVEVESRSAIVPNAITNGRIVRSIGRPTATQELIIEAQAQHAA